MRERGRGEGFICEKRRGESEERGVTLHVTADQAVLFFFSKYIFLLSKANKN